MQMAGFEHWDTIMWLYGEGFPKAMDIGKQVAELTGERPIAEIPNPAFEFMPTSGQTSTGWVGQIPKTKRIYANEWQGYKTPALKPAYEPILCFRAPRQGLNYGELALKFGTGCLNIDGGRIGTETISTHNAPAGTFAGGEPGRGSDTDSYNEHSGRYPANLILDQESAAMLDKQSGKSVSGKQKQPRGTGGMWSGVSNTPCGPQYGDAGGASRFFYCAKASKGERDAGCEGMPVVNSGMSNGAQSHGEGYDKGQGIGLNRVIRRYNDHPCVKPLALTRHLAALLLPPASVAPRRLLVPFCGSGSEMIGALQGWDEIVGIEQDSHYCEIPRRRLEYWSKLPPASPGRTDAA
jgi:hypothetical protein